MLSLLILISLGSVKFIYDVRVTRLLETVRRATSFSGVHIIDREGSAAKQKHGKCYTEFLFMASWFEIKVLIHFNRMKNCKTLEWMVRREWCRVDHSSFLCISSAHF